MAKQLTWQALDAQVRARAQGRCECRGECGLGHKLRCEATVGSRTPSLSVPVFLTLAILPDASAIATCPACHVAIDRRVIA